MADKALPKLVVVHPVVLLSVVDHYTRVAKDTKNRVVGILLGEKFKGRVDVTNCYAVPFDEDVSKNATVWYFDHLYHENMLRMFRKVNAREKVVGWYSIGPDLKPHDLEINSLISKYCSQPLYVLVDVVPKNVLPVTANVQVTETKEDGTVTKSTFAHVPCQVGALEAEEIGVEHLLRDVKDTKRSRLSTVLSASLLSLDALGSHLDKIKEYLDDVVADKLPVSNEISGLLQDVFNLLPSLNVQPLLQAMTVKTNDLYMAMSLGAVTRSILSMHDLINNTEIYHKKTAEAAASTIKSELDYAKKAEKKRERDAESDDGAEEPRASDDLPPDNEPKATNGKGAGH